MSDLIGNDEYTRGWLCGRQTQLATVCEDLDAILAGKSSFGAIEGELGERYQKLRERVAILVQIAAGANELVQKGTQMAEAARRVVETAMKGRKCQ